MFFPSLTAGSEANAFQQPCKANLMARRRAWVASAALVIVAAVLFAGFAVYYKVHVSDVNENIAWLGTPPIQNSPLFSGSTFPAGGFDISPGGSSHFVAGFLSGTSCPVIVVVNFTADNGFSVSHLNTTLPVSVSPTSPSTYIDATIVAPNQPYTGSVEVTITAGCSNSST